MKNLKIYFTAITVFIFVSCKYEMPVEPGQEPPSTGSVNFSKYVSIGDGITAGFMDAALYYEGQQNSFPNLLSKKINEVSSVTFNQPLFGSPTDNGFNPIHSVLPSLIFGKLKLIQPACLQSSITAMPTMGIPLTPYTGDKSTLNNYGVLGLKMVEVTFSGYGMLNPFFGRFASNPATASVLSDAASKQPTFFTLWLGNQDVLGYATSGGTGNIDGIGQNDMTNIALFDTSLKITLNTLIAAGNDVKGAVANIPDVLHWPFFYTINNSLTGGKKIPFTLSQGMADTLNFLYFSSTGMSPDFTGSSNNFFVIETATGIRQMNPSEDYLLLSVSSDSLGTGPIDLCDPAGTQRPGWGITKPIPNQFVLDKTEVDNVRNKITEYNSSIVAAVSNYTNVVIVDMRALMQQLNTTGVSAGIGFVKADIPFGGAISLDGLHPTPKGNAVFANKFIETINNEFGANLHKLDPTKYRGIEIP